MGAKIISVTNLKGGVGKTTLATNLAVCFAHRGFRVCIADSDQEQRSSIVWSNQRADDALRVPVFGIGEKVNKEIEALKADYDLVLIDGAPDASEIAFRTISISDVVIVPVKPSLYDFRAFEEFFEGFQRVANVARDMGKRIEGRVLLNCIEPNTLIARDMREGMKQYGEEMPVFSVEITSRVAYSTTPTLGLGITEYRDLKAKKEIETLADDIQKILDLM